MNIGELWATLGIDSTGLEHSIVAMRQWETKASASLLKVQRRLDQTSARLAGMRRSMMTNMVLPMALVGAASFKLYKDFEFNMNKVVSLVGVPRKQMEEWSKEILTMASRVGKGPVELARAMYFITSAGIRGAEAMEILEESAKSSASGLGEVKTVADLLTSAMNAYGKENLSAAKANDILTATVREGKAEADLLAQSLGLVLPIASAMGSGFEQVGAATAAMTRTGTKAATAAIQLRQIFNSLLKPAKEAEAALGHMGTSSEELRRIIKEEGLMAALVELDNITKEYGINAVGKVIPNIRSLTGFLDIMGKNFEENAKLTDAIRDSFGDANKMFEETAHTVEFRLNAAIARGQSSMVKFGEAVTAGVLPIIERLSMRLEKIVERFDALSDTEKTARIQAGLLVGKVFILTFIFERLTKTASNLIFVFRSLLKWIAKVQWPAFATILGKIHMSLKAIGTVGASVAGAFGTILAAGTIYGRKIEKGLKKEYELRSSGITLMGEQLKAYKKLNAVQRELELRRLTEIEHQKELNAQYGVFIGLLDTTEALTMEALSLPGMNISQLESFRDKTTGAMGDIQSYIEDLAKTEEIEIPVGLTAMDPGALVSYFKNQAQMIEGALVEGFSGQEMYTAYQGTFQDIGGSLEEEMAKSSTGMSDVFSENAMDMASTMGIVADTMLNAFNTGDWLKNPAEGFFGDMAESSEETSELMVQMAQDTANKEKKILKEKLESYKTILSLIQFEIEKQAEESNKKRRSLEEAAVGTGLTASLKSIATMGTLVWTELEVAEAKVDAFSKAMKSLSDLGIGPADDRLQMWTASLKRAQEDVTRLDVDVTDLNEAMKDLQKTLAIAAYKGAAFPDFDPGEANLKAYESYLNKLIERRTELLSVAGPTETTAPDISFLMWDTSAPENYKTEIMRVEEQIAAATVAMEKFKLTAGKPTGMQLFGELGAVMQEIGAADLTPLEHARAMFNAFEDAKIAAFDSQMVGKELSNFTEMTQEEMDNWAAVIDKITFWDKFMEQARVAARAISELFGSLTNYYGTLMQNEIEIAEKSAKAKGKSEKWLANEREKIQKKYAQKMQAFAIAEAIIGGALAIVGIWKSYTGLGPWGIVAAAALTGMVAAATGVQIATIKAQKMAVGGVVPPGYPGDSYPALLTSGEEVIPARRTKEDKMGGEVVFRIEGDELVGILKKRESVNANF